MGSRFDYAGGSEDQGYAQTFESFFKEKKAEIECLISCAVRKF